MYSLKKDWSDYVFDTVVTVITAAILICIPLGFYGGIGSESKVPIIKQEAPEAFKERHWKILRYEGYERGSFGNHGGKVWYHVQDVNNPNIQYRVAVTKWKNELHFHYNSPEQLIRINNEK